MERHVLPARMDSIERRLLLLLLLASLGVSAVLAGTTAWIVRQKVSDLLDYQLEQTARTLLAQGDDEPRVVDDDPALHLEAQMWDASGRKLWRTGDDLNLPIDTPLGLADVQVDNPGNNNDSTARVYTVRDAHHTVQVAIETSVHDGLAISEGLEMLWPSFLSLLTLSFAILLTVRHQLRPLRALDAELAQRSAQSLAPIELERTPLELRQPIATLNSLLGRLDHSLQTHRRFVADAAHELRTPLAAIRLQASNVFTARDAAARDAARSQLMRGIDRAQHLVQQMLTLARFEPGGAELALERIDLRGIAQDSLVDLSALADDKGIELSLTGADTAWVHGEKDALRILIDNLVGNAIKYSPGGTSVSVSLLPEASGAVTLCVSDQGPGIAPQARQRMFERFTRHGWTGSHAQADTPKEPGSGLGLAIVADIVRAHGAQIDLHQTSAEGGLEVTVVFGADAAAGTSRTG